MEKKPTKITFYPYSRLSAEDRGEIMRALSSELGLAGMRTKRRDGFCISAGSEKSTHLEFERCEFGSLFAPEGPSPMRKRAIITKL